MVFSMEYEIKDTTRRDSNVFAERPLPPLPTPKCDWSAFPKPEWQPPIVKHYHDKHGDDLLARNVYEVQRMVYTIYNAIGADPHNLPFPADFGVTIGQTHPAPPQPLRLWLHRSLVVKSKIQSFQ